MRQSRISPAARQKYHSARHSQRMRVVRDSVLKADKDSLGLDGLITSATCVPMIQKEKMTDEHST